MKYNIETILSNGYVYGRIKHVKNVAIKTNKKSIERMVSLCKVDLPKKFMKVMEKYENNPIALRDAGIAYAIDQIVDLIASGVDGIHLYTMNNPYIAKKICEAISSII